ncbi:MAG TPA: hypothetical protein VFD30_02555, partial [Terriglobia bacterium]|nr:hypothetical protein [Terriglobia bacterium]
PNARHHQQYDVDQRYAQRKFKDTFGTVAMSVNMHLYKSTGVGGGHQASRKVAAHTLVYP